MSVPQHQPLFNLWPEFASSGPLYSTVLGPSPMCPPTQLLPWAHCFAHYSKVAERLPFRILGALHPGPTPPSVSHRIPWPSRSRNAAARSGLCRPSLVSVQPQHYSPGFFFSCFTGLLPPFPLNLPSAPFSRWKSSGHGKPAGESGDPTWVVLWTWEQSAHNQWLMGRSR